MVRASLGEPTWAKIQRSSTPRQHSSEKLQKLVPNSPEAFAAKFVKIMKALDRNDMGYPEKLCKKIFLNKILDKRRFSLWKANIKRDKKDTMLKQILSEFRQEAIQLIKKPAADPMPRNVNTGKLKGKNKNGRKSGSLMKTGENSPKLNISYQILMERENKKNKSGGDKQPRLKLLVQYSESYTQ